MYHERSSMLAAMLMMCQRRGAIEAFPTSSMLQRCHCLVDDQYNYIDMQKTIPLRQQRLWESCGFPPVIRGSLDDSLYVTHRSLHLYYASGQEAVFSLPSPATMRGHADSVASYEKCLCTIALRTPLQ